jgi:transcriptional regulator with XRE-family HTH domain
MPPQTPRQSEQPPEDAAFVADVLASNVRAFRLLRGIDQATLARMMLLLRHDWRQVTVSEVENGRRNVTAPELVGLVVALGATVEQLFDPRGPERKKGPALALTSDVDYLVEPEIFRHLLCESPEIYAEAVWTYEDGAKRFPRKVRIEFTDKTEGKSS